MIFICKQSQARLEPMNMHIMWFLISFSILDVFLILDLEYQPVWTSFNFWLCVSLELPFGFHPPQPIMPRHGITSWYADINSISLLSNARIVPLSLYECIFSGGYEGHTSNLLRSNLLTSPLSFLGRQCLGANACMIFFLLQYLNFYKSQFISSITW